MTLKIISHEKKKKWQTNYDAEHTITLEYHTQTIEQCVNMIADASFKILKIVEPKPREDLKKAIQGIMINAQEYHAS